MIACYEYLVFMRQRPQKGVELLARRGEIMRAKAPGEVARMHENVCTGGCKFVMYSLSGSCTLLCAHTSLRNPVKKFAVSPMGVAHMHNAHPFRVMPASAGGSELLSQATSISLWYHSHTCH